jgi:hypothetical protein
VNLDWRRLKAVVIESDDWGLCAWSTDAHAFRVLADTPVYRHPAGRRYGGSTLESAEDMAALRAILEGSVPEGAIPPVLQANTVMASPDYDRLRPPMFEAEVLPLTDFPATPARWRRPGLDRALHGAIDAGVWWPELHGLHHLPEAAWLRGLRRGESDARRAFEQQSMVCSAVETGGEYGAAEPLDLRRRNLALAVEKFRATFGRAPASFCPPDYHWDDALDRDAETLGLRIFQGVAESAGARVPRFRRLFHRFRWPHFEGARFVLPPRIAFEPLTAEGPSEALGVDRTWRAVQEAWGRGQPAVVSSHRMNFVHLQTGWADSGREALGALLARLTGAGAMFLVDFEVRELLERGWSLRRVGASAAVLRYFGVPGAPVLLAALAGVDAAAIRTAGAGARFEPAEGGVMARVNVGSYRLDWGRA